MMFPTIQRTLSAKILGMLPVKIQAAKAAMIQARMAATIRGLAGLDSPVPWRRAVDEQRWR
jgi:hypothetical protein